MRTYLIHILSLITLVAILLTACSQSEVTSDVPSPEEQPLAVSFTPYLTLQRDTRTTYPEATPPATSTGKMSTNKLKETGFGVFAQYTEDEVFAYNTAVGKGIEPFNFMWNQQVTWDNTLDDSHITKWTYNPVKYWPNDNNPADDETAIGSKSRSYVSFYAYAPYQAETSPTTGFDKTDEDTDSDSNPDADGIVKITDNTASAGKGSYLIYRTSNTHPFFAEHSVDLLWAAQPNLYKMKPTGEGYTNGRVQFVFKHALAKLTFTVQGLFDHVNNDDTTPDYPDDVDDNTRIFIESVSFEDSPLFTEGNMFVAPRPDNATVPYWEVNNSLETRPANIIKIEGTDINPLMADAYLDGITHKNHHEFDDTDEATALTNFEALPEGVTHTERSLFAQDDFFYMVIPNKKYITDNPADLMKVRMVYYVITYDPQLTLNNPKYYSIVKNDVTVTFSNAFVFEANKAYNLRLQPGLTTVKFTVLSVDDWETPITLNPIVLDWQTKTVGEYELDNSNTVDTTP